MERIQWVQRSKGRALNPQEESYEGRVVALQFRTSGEPGVLWKKINKKIKIKDSETLNPLNTE